MNERILELAHQVDFINKKHKSVDEWRWGYIDSELSDKLTKFAELIAQECIGITDDLVNRNADGTWASDELYTDYNGALFQVKTKIQQTFGVE